mgnify:CR=1 FL=1
MEPTTWMPVRKQEPFTETWLSQAVSGGKQTLQGKRLESILGSFDPISLEEMDAVALLNRIDTKFVLQFEQLLQALSVLQVGYRVLSVAGQRINHYRTLYFDTCDFDLYKMHVNEHADRFKVRSREYVDSQQAFLEVKHRTRKDRTVKSRIPTGTPAVWIDAAARRWLKDVFPYDSSALEPKLWNTFTRITLVNRALCERVTLDVDLTFFNLNRCTRLDGIAVAEVKQASRDCPSDFMAQMHALKVRPQGFSKYCIGASLLYENVKKNSLKAKLLWLEKNCLGVQHE